MWAEKKESNAEGEKIRAMFAALPPPRNGRYQCRTSNGRDTGKKETKTGVWWGEGTAEGEGEGESAHAAPLYLPFLFSCVCFCSLISVSPLPSSPHTLYSLHSVHLRPFETRKSTHTHTEGRREKDAKYIYRTYICVYTYIYVGKERNTARLKMRTTTTTTKKNVLRTAAPRGMGWAGRIEGRGINPNMENQKERRTEGGEGGNW